MALTAPAPRDGRPSGVPTPALLSAGIVGAGVYAVGDLLCARRYPGYSVKDQAISELSAYGSPVRPLMVTFLTAHGLLIGVFAVGVRRAAPASRALEVTAGSLLASVVSTLPLHPFFPMSSRGLEKGTNDRVHIDLTVVFSVLVSSAVASSAVARRGPFRIYAIASEAVMAAFGVLAGRASRGLATGGPTPWMGAFERVNAYTYLAWISALAVALRDRRSACPASARVRMPRSIRRIIGKSPNSMRTTASAM